MSRPAAQSELRRRPAYMALEAHREQIGSPARAVRAGPRSRHPPDDRGRGPVSGLLQELGHGRDAEAAQHPRRGVRSARAHRRDVRGRADQRHRRPLRPAHRAAGTEKRRDRRRRHGCRARGPRRAGADGHLRGRDPLRRVERALGTPHPQRGQHRHRRLRPRAGDGLRGAAPLRHARVDLPVRLQRRRDGLRRGHARPRPGRDAVHRRVEDVHHARDDDQRAARRGTGR